MPSMEAAKSSFFMCFPSLLNAGLLPASQSSLVHCCAVSRGAVVFPLTVEIVFHDGAVAAGSVALQRIDIAGKLAASVASTASIACRSSAVSTSEATLQIGREMRAVAGADDDGGNAGPRQHRGTGHGGDVRAVAPGNGIEHAQAAPGTGPSRRTRR